MAEFLALFCDVSTSGNQCHIDSKFCPIPGDQQNTITKVNLLNKVLGIVAGVLLIDHEVRRKEFQQVPYHR